jgi:hypothetical protein
MYDATYFAEWEGALRSKVQRTLPSRDVLSVGGYLPALHLVDGAQANVEAAQRRHDQLQKQPTAKQQEGGAGDDGDAKAAAAILNESKSNLEAAQKALEDAEAKCQAAGFVVLEELERRSFFDGPSSENNNSSNDTSNGGGGFDDADLITYVTLVTVGPKKWAEWCARGETETALLMSVLRDPGTLRRFHAAGGGPRDNNWLAAVEAHSKLGSSAGLEKDRHPVLRRLALAVALELAGVLPVRIVECELDPLERYLHYEKAYLDGELDPVFERLCAWELRMAIDSDASHSELRWARACLRNYRPDHVLTDDPQWRYCRIVRTDVGYNKPDWYKPQRSYDQILSGGGQCGPRAWYGRFVCKAFGMPTWGCRQPGHAAMARWTANGWQTCLGAGLHRSEWENKTGNFFQAEMLALYALRSEEAYLRKVLRLWMVGNVWESEPSRDLVRRALPSAKCPWKSLSFLQMKRLASATPSLEPLFPRTGEVETLLERLLHAPVVNEQILKDTSRGVVAIPGTCASSESRCTYMKCFEGGRQVLLGENNAEVVYTLEPQHLVAGAVLYRLTIRVCTVHRNEEPASLTITSNRSTRVYSIQLPYSAGEWKETDPVVVELYDTGAVLKLVRQSKKYAISIRSVQLESLQ